MSTQAKQRVRHALDALEELPSMPLVTQRVGELVNDPKSNIREIADALRADPGLTSKIIRFVNSPFFSLPTELTDVTRAVSIMGCASLYKMVLAISVLEIFEQPNGYQESAARYFQHCAAVASIAELLASKLGGVDPAGAFTTGLLHDLGRLAIMHVDPDLAEQTLDYADQNRIPLVDAEQKLASVRHDQIGLRLAKRWRLPAEIQAVVAHHHTEKTNRRTGISAKHNREIDIVFLSDIIARQHGAALSKSDEPKTPSDCMHRLQVTSDHFYEWEEDIYESMERAERLAKTMIEPTEP